MRIHYVHLYIKDKGWRGSGLHNLGEFSCSCWPAIQMFYLALQVSTHSQVELAHNIRKTELLNPLETLPCLLVEAVQTLSKLGKAYSTNRGDTVALACLSWSVEAGIFVYSTQCFEDSRHSKTVWQVQKSSLSCYCHQ